MASESINSRARATKDSFKFLVERHPRLRLLSEQLIEWHCPVPTHKTRSFTTSKMGINISLTNAGKRKRDTTSDWKQDMVEACDVNHLDQDWLWSPITHRCRPPNC
ncbi:hypothetical protein N7527_009325 [Penicillium freii]|nr:hypothetical protein N7527_009325 [Penicillium freii]